MKRYTITPQPKKSIKIPSSIIKPSPFPRMSMAANDTSQKDIRNVRDKEYRSACAENIMLFFSENGYDGQYNQKILSSPSSKEFQNMFKFIYSFIDPTPFNKFEEDVISILKLMKYPYSSEITKSQLAVVTPHTWPAVLSMMSWMVDLIRKTDDANSQTATVESEFLEFVCEGYMKFMEGVEDDSELEAQFINKVGLMQSKEKEEILNRKDEVGLMKNELENLKSKFEDLSKAEKKKKKINDDLNALILNDKQLEMKKTKYMSSIEKLVEDISALEAHIDELIKVKNDLLSQINSQTINPHDIREMNIEKVELFKELEKLKPEREGLAKTLKASENRINCKIDELEKVISEIKALRPELPIENCVSEMQFISYSVIGDLEGDLSRKRESIVNYELSHSTLEDKIRDKNSQFKDFEEQYNHLNSKLQTIGSIYLEKKEISERSQHKNRNEMDRLENELLKLKLDSDSLYLKSEKDLSEAKIKLDILNSQIAREKEEINRMVWDFYNIAESVIKTLEFTEKEVKKITK